MVSPGGLPFEVSRFIATHITNIEQLEILDFLLRYSSRLWSPEAIALRLRTSAAVVTRRIAPLVEDGLVARRQNEPPRYQYSPRNTTLDEMVRAALLLHGQRKADVIAEICARPNVSNWPGRRR